jgi:hypothetical protein
MTRNLMARDEMRNLGFWEDEGGAAANAKAGEGGPAAKASDTARKKGGEAAAGTGVGK